METLSIIVFTVAILLFGAACFLVGISFQLSKATKRELEGLCAQAREHAVTCTTHAASNRDLEGQISTLRSRVEGLKLGAQRTY